jgi:hypothetical protein
VGAIASITSSGVRNKNGLVRKEFFVVAIEGSIVTNENC